MRIIKVKKIKIKIKLRVEKITKQINETNVDNKKAAHTGENFKKEYIKYQNTLSQANLKRIAMFIWIVCLIGSAASNRDRERERVHANRAICERGGGKEKHTALSS